MMERWDKKEVIPIDNMDQQDGINQDGIKTDRISGQQTEVTENNLLAEKIPSPTRRKSMLIAVVSLMVLIAVIACAFLLVDKSVAVVNGEKITKESLYQKMFSRSGQDVLEELISQKLIDQEAAKQGITVSEAEIQKQVDQFVAEQFPSREVFLMTLQQYQLTENDFRDSMRLDLLTKKLLAGKVQVTEDEVKQYYETHQDEFNQKEMVRASHILVATEQEAQAVLKNLKEGADFSKLAQEKSIDNSTADKGGDLGFFERGKMVPEFEKVAFSLPVDATSEPVKSSFGYHVIRVQEKRPAKQFTFAEVKTQVEEKVKESKISEMAPQFLTELRSKAEIKYKVPVQQNEQTAQPGN